MGGGVDGRGGGEGSGRVVGVREDVLAAVLEDMEVDDAKEEEQEQQKTRWRRR